MKTFEYLWKVIIVVWMLFASFSVSHAGVDQLSWKLEYDTDGKIIARIGPDGNRTEFDYHFDNSGNPLEFVRRSPGDVPVEVGYDTFGRREKMIDSEGEITYEYDVGGRLTAVRHNGKVSVLFGYNTMDRLISMRVADEFSVGYSYDFLGRREKITTPAGDIEYLYNAKEGVVVRTLPNGVRTRMQYGPDGNLATITHKPGDDPIIAQFAYFYRPDRLIDSIFESNPYHAGTVNFEYDIEGRLVAVEDSRGNRTEYTYDQFGNRLAVIRNGQPAVSASYDWIGRIEKLGATLCSHDNAGNVTAINVTDREIGLTYTSEGQVEEIVSARGKVHYRYDGDGYLVSRESGGTVTQYVVDPTTDIWRPLLAKSDDHTTYYIWDDETLLLMIKDGEPVYFLHDHLGSVRAGVDQNGQAIDYYDYTPFGAPREKLPGTELWPGFASLFLDPVSSLYLTRARAYDPQLGRFLQIDPRQRMPSGDQSDFTFYTYCGNDPVNLIDRNGEEPRWVWGPENWCWQVTHNLGNLLDYNYAQRWYARRSEEALDRGAGWTATGWDILGGYIPGEGANEGQRRASIMWGLMPHVKVARTFGSVFINASEGDLKGMTLDVVSLVGSNFGYKAKAATAAGNKLAYGTIVEKNGQLAWGGFLDKSRYVKGQRLLQVGRNYREMEQVIDLVTQPHELRDRLIDLGQEYSKLYPSGPDISETSLRQNRVQFEQLDQAVRSTTSHHSYGIGFNGKALNRAIDEHERMRREYSDPTKYVMSGPPPPPPMPIPILSPSASMRPTNVGGVYLRGAGEALKDFDNIAGVAIDEKSGQLILLANADGGEIDLPPLRMDDIVTIFRSVYLHGEAPYVSIDPDPKDPEGPWMLVRHGKETAETYVGWILFQTDRIMKAYSLGFDNVTQKEVESEIADFRNLFELGMASDEMSENSVWERFWIVPDSVTRSQSTAGKLTLLDAPLKVNTERMILRDGVLETAPDPTPTEPAAQFTEWFTRSYNQIAHEFEMIPPPETGIDTAVEIFSELQRIALVTAIAETLRDQKIPFPSWMHDYKVRPCPIDRATPRIGVTAYQIQTSRFHQDGQMQEYADTTRQIWIRGGVNLGPAEEDIRVIASAPGADNLMSQITEFADEVPMLSPMEIDSAGDRILAVALPGANTRDLAACQLDEVDLSVPVLRGARISLVRRYNSFFEPDEVFGPGWSLDLPCLKQLLGPKKQAESSEDYESHYQLTSAHNSFSALFRESRFVPEFETELLVPETPGMFLGLASDSMEQIGFRTNVLLLNNGHEWHFDDSGWLAAIVEAPQTTIFRRYKTGQIYRVEGWYGKYLRADIVLEYNDKGRVTLARGKTARDTTEIHYRYDDQGRLSEADGQFGRRRYEYVNDLVHKIYIDTIMTGEFGYGSGGQLVWEKQFDLPKISYEVSSGAGEMSVKSSTDSGVHSSYGYDDSFRPTNQSLPDGTEMAWQYDSTGEAKIRTQLSGGEELVAVVSANSDRIQWRYPDDQSMTTQYDVAGRPVVFSHNSQKIFSQEYRQDGQMASAEFETFDIYPIYREDGVLTSLTVAEPDDDENNGQWLDVEFDELGRTVGATDAYGAEFAIGYDSSGMPNVFASNHGRVNMDRDLQGRLTDLKTTWGYTVHNSYSDDATGELTKSVASVGDVYEAVEFDQGRLVGIEHFDGGHTSIEYFGDSLSQDLVKQVRTPSGLILQYQYEESQPGESGNLQRNIKSVVCGDTYAVDFIYDDQYRLKEIKYRAL